MGPVRGIIEAVTSHLFPFSSPSASVLPQTWQTCKWSCQYQPHWPLPLHHHPTNKSGPFAEMGAVTHAGCHATSSFSSVTLGIALKSQYGMQQREICVWTHCGSIQRELLQIPCSDEGTHRGESYTRNSWWVFYFYVPSHPLLIPQHCSILNPYFHWKYLMSTYFTKTYDRDRRFPLVFIHSASKSIFCRINDFRDFHVTS